MRNLTSYGSSPFMQLARLLWDHYDHMSHDKVLSTPRNYIQQVDY